MSDNSEFIWSNTDYPYACLVDKRRTLAFKDAIERTVKSGDVVIDAGSGSGILSLFAARAGASKVLAVEIDHTLATALRNTVETNGFSDVIEVIEGDVMALDLPQNVDVVVAELMETGLIDEMQVAVMNNFHERGIIGSDTRVIPGSYETFVQPIELNNDFFGFNMRLPFHVWPFYSSNPDEWVSVQYKSLTSPQSLGFFNFQKGAIDPVISSVVRFELPESSEANAVLLSGRIGLAEDVYLDACNTLNGDKIFPMTLKNNGVVDIAINYAMSEGLKSLRIESVIDQ